MKINPRLIIGLGNPGKKYQHTYHNVGFLFIDYLKQKGKDKNFILLKPKTFMNESGKAVAAALKHFGAKPEEILVIHDDSDIELGKSKLSFGRGAAGHKGVQSIIDELKTSAQGGSASGGKNFWRLRIGIRRLKPKTYNLKPNLKAGEIVLTKITSTDKLILEKVFNELEI
jgi:PTH1 family peptidyl-tRNA hydrolase